MFLQAQWNGPNLLFLSFLYQLSLQSHFPGASDFQSPGSPCLGPEQALSALHGYSFSQQFFYGNMHWLSQFHLQARRSSQPPYWPQFQFGEHCPMHALNVLPGQQQHIYFSF